MTVTLAGAVRTFFLPPEADCTLTDTLSSSFASNLSYLLSCFNLLYFWVESGDFDSMGFVESVLCVDSCSPSLNEFLAEWVREWVESWDCVESS